MTPSSLCFRAGVLILLAGMAWGLHMGISGNHVAFPAHAHLNLLGFVALFLFGFFYRLHPSIESNRLAFLQVWIWIAGTIILSVGVGLLFLGFPIGDPCAAIGSIIVLVDGFLFAWLVFRATPVKAGLS